MLTIIFSRGMLSVWWLCSELRECSFYGLWDGANKKLVFLLWWLVHLDSAWRLNFTWQLKSNPITSTPATYLFRKDKSWTLHAFGVVLSRGMGWQYLQLHLTYVLNIQLYLCRYMKTYIHEFISSHIPTWLQKNYAISRAKSLQL